MSGSLLDNVAEDAQDDDGLPDANALPQGNAPQQPTPQQAPQGNAPQGNAPQGNVPQAAQNNPPVGPRARPANDTPIQRNRRWSTYAKGVFNLPDLQGQNGIFASADATCHRIDEMTLQPGGAAKLAGTGQGDALFQTFVTELGKYEALQLPRSMTAAQPLKAAATAARQAAGNDPTKLKPIDDTLEALTAFDLRQSIMAAGPPPWTDRVASNATANKVKLDMLSMGPDRTLTPQGGGVNPSYWVERSKNDALTDEDGKTEALKSFLCKPRGALVYGIPAGGEIAREALTGRTASILKSKVKLDLDMPETHVVDMPEAAFPKKPKGGQGGQVACSVQEAKNVKSDFADATPSEREALPAEQCAAVLFLDMATLNTDRHIGNLMLGNDGGMVPIDHGCAFPSMDEDGLERVRTTMSSPHNVVLQLPGAHRPMSDEMAAGLRGLDPAAIRTETQRNVAAVENEHQAMAGMVEPGTLDATMASTRFLKLSGDIEGGRGRSKTRLSPGSVMVAFGTNSDELLAMQPLSDPKVAKAFDKRARELLKQALVDQPIIAQFCTMDDATNAVYVDKLTKLGWTMQERKTAPHNSISGDPVLCAKLLAGRIANPNAGNNGDDGLVQRQTAYALVKRAKPKPDAASAALADCQMEALDQLVDWLPRDRAGPLKARIARNSELRTEPAICRKLILQVQEAVEGQYRARLKQMTDRYDFKDPWLDEVVMVKNGTRFRKYALCTPALDKLADAVARGLPGVTTKTQAQPMPDGNDANDGDDAGSGNDNG